MGSLPIKQPQDTSMYYILKSPKQAELICTAPDTNVATSIADSFYKSFQTLVAPLKVLTSSMCLLVTDYKVFAAGVPSTIKQWGSL